MNNKQTLWVIGDSTVSSFNDKYYYPRFGYGTKLECYLDDCIEVRNIALSGRSSKSYLEEPEYKELITGMKQGDFLLIGFGHNDEKTETERFTSANGTYKEKGTFAASLYENYIKKAENTGCQTILCTPVVRRTATGEWKEQELHITKDTADFPGGDYAEAVRKLGKMLSVPVVDMTSMTKALYDELKPDNTIYLHAWPSNNKASVDNTHTNVWGARVNAYLCLKEIKKLNIKGLSEHVTGIDEDAPYPEMDKYLYSDENYVPTVFDANLSQSKLWEDAGIWKGTVFGDLTEKIDTDSFVMQPLADDSVHIAVKNNSGKIAAVSDGIAMYYTKIPAGRDFELTAKAVINDYFLNDQVSFGLMVRDDMYIDKVTPDILGDYVAAAPLLLTHGAGSVNCFARKSGVLTYGGECTRKYESGETVDLKIESTSDGYACKFADEETITGGFDFKLTSIDPENVYAGVFVSRNADVTFYDINLELK